MNENESKPRHRSGGEIAFGLALVAGGSVLLLDNMGVIAVRLADLWPLALIYCGVDSLINRLKRVDQQETHGRP